jgi:hypothetical protein
LNELREKADWVKLRKSLKKEAKKPGKRLKEATRDHRNRVDRAGAYNAGNRQTESHRTEEVQTTATL